MRRRTALDSGANVFETEAEAEEHGQRMCSNYSQRAEVLHSCYWPE